MLRLLAVVSIFFAGAPEPPVMVTPVCLADNNGKCVSDKKKPPPKSDVPAETKKKSNG